MGWEYLHLEKEYYISHSTGERQSVDPILIFDGVSSQYLRRSQRKVEGPE